MRNSFVDDRIIVTEDESEPASQENISVMLRKR